jgi:hypothetical protein
MRSHVGVAGIFAAGMCIGLGGCAGSIGEKHARIAQGDSAQGAAALERLKPLAGEWDMVGDDGKRSPGLVISVSSAGSAIREIMFQGSGHEMTNMYHADGDSVIMTHYCAVGNQPRMRAKATTDGPLSFEFDSVTNLKGKSDTYMGRMKLTIVDANTIHQEWNHFTLKDGMQAPNVFTYKRKGS